VEDLVEIADNDEIDLKTLSRTNFVKILFDLSLYEYQGLVNKSFELLVRTHSQR